MDSPAQLDMLVVTAVLSEESAVREVFANAGCKFTNKSWKGQADNDRLDYEEVAWQPSASQETFFKIGLAKLRESGRDATSRLMAVLKLAITNSSKSVNLKYLAMVGVCAGNPYFDDLQLGDIIVPHIIATTRGKVTPDGHAPQATQVKQSDAVAEAVHTAQKSWCTGNKWKEHLPKDLQNFPSPEDLQQAILTKLHAAQDTEGLLIKTIYDDVASSYKWSAVVQQSEVSKALEILYACNMVKKTTKDEVMKFSLTSNQSQKVVTPPRCPSVYVDGSMIEGTLVRTDLTTEKAWTDLGKETGQRKIAGYEMESYTFANEVHSSLRSRKTPIKWLVIKSPSDIGNDRLKMDYYQKYAASVATAFLLHYFKSEHELRYLLPASAETAASTASEINTGRDGTESEIAKTAVGISGGESGTQLPPLQTAQPSSHLSTKADCKVEPKHLVAVAAKIGDWGKLAAYLSPKKFSTVQLERIKEDHGNEFLRARAALDAWSNAHDTEATCRRLIESLCEMGQRALAAEEFGSHLVNFVKPQ